MLGKELALRETGWRKLFYSSIGTLDVDEWIWYWHYRRFLFPYLRSLQSGTILDAGCNYGLWSFCLAKKFPQLTITGIDFREDPIVFCQEAQTCLKLENLQFQNEDFSRLNRSGEFDLILCLFSLHYSYANDVDVLKRFAQALKPGGLLVLTLPVSNVLRRGANLSNSTKQTIKYGITVTEKEFEEHYSVDELLEKLSAAGFQITTVQRFVRPGVQAAKDWYTRASKRMFQKMLIWPIAFVWGWLDSMFLTEQGWYLFAIARSNTK